MTKRTALTRRIEKRLFQEGLGIELDTRSYYDTSNPLWPAALFLVRVNFESNLGIMQMDYVPNELERLDGLCDLMDSLLLPEEGLACTR